MNEQLTEELTRSLPPAPPRLSLLAIAVLIGAFLVACDSGGSSSETDTGVTDDTRVTEDTAATEDTSTTGDTGEPSDTAVGDVGADSADTGPQFPIGPEGPTYHEHIAPLLARECLSCHRDGGIGPFELGTYEQAAPIASAIAAATSSRQMPPYPVDNSGSCHKFKDARWLEDDEIELIAQWAQNGAPEGDPANDHATPPDLPGLGTVTSTLDIGEDYVPDASLSDDYRCFIVDPKNTGDAFLTGFEVRPGNDAIVHHMILYSVPDQAAEDRAYELDAQSPDTPGYRCFGLSRLNNSMMIAAWAPGTPATHYPEDTGVRIVGNRPLIMQMHYNLANNADPDRTQIDLKLAEDVKNEAYLVPIPHSDMELQPGQAEEVTSFEMDVPLPVPIKLRGVFPHMHTLGTKLNAEVIDGSGNSQCIVDVPRWDFGWQQGYFYTEPMEIEPSTTLRLTCTYDTRSRSEPVYWGEGTMDEMCLLIGYATIL